VAKLTLTIEASRAEIKAELQAFAGAKSIVRGARRRR